MVEAQRLQAAYADRIHILIGFETDFIRPSFGPRVLELAAPACVDYYIGSVHHVHGLPIDYDRALYDEALAQSSSIGGDGSAAAAATEQGLWADYYDEQLDMLRALRPRVVGHFDLIRLLSDAPGRDVREWPAVWEKIKRNLEVVREQGGRLECNSAALRKGLDEPYPCRTIAEVSSTHALTSPSQDTQPPVVTNEAVGMGQDGREIHNVRRQPRHRPGGHKLLPCNHLPGEPRRQGRLDVSQETAPWNRGAVEGGPRGCPRTPLGVPRELSCLRGRAACCWHLEVFTTWARRGTSSPSHNILR